MAQKNIIQFFGGYKSTKRFGNFTSMQETDKWFGQKKNKGKFRDEWTNEYEWLIYDEEQGVIICKWCKEATRKISLALRAALTFREVHLIGILMSVLTTFKFRMQKSYAQEKKQFGIFLNANKKIKVLKVMILRC